MPADPMLSLPGYDIAASAWSVVDDEWLSKPLRQPLPHQARVYRLFAQDTGCKHQGRNFFRASLLSFTLP